MRRLSVHAAAALLTAVAAALAPLETPPAAAKPGPGAQRKLRGSLSSALRRAGGADGAEVLDLTSGRILFAAATTTPRLPASVEKLYTTSTALLRFGPSATLTTRVLGVGSFNSAHAWRGTLYLKGGGDPTFGSSSFDRYAYGAGATVQRLVTDLFHATRVSSIRGRIVGDESTFDSLRGTPATGFAENAYVEGVLSALAYDRGFVSAQGAAFQTRPALFATQQFVSALRAAHIRVAGNTRIYTARTPARAQLLANVHSPQIATLLRLTNTPSDNFFAEMLLKDIGSQFGGAGTTAAGARVVRTELASNFGIYPRLDDGSGLSRADGTSPAQVITLLDAMSGSHPFTSSLAVAGVSGTMAYEDRGTAAQSRCRGKTGTLHDVANLVGYCTARDGHQLAFAFLMNSVDPTAGHSAEDQMMLSVAKYNG